VGSEGSIGLAFSNKSMLNNSAMRYMLIQLICYAIVGFNVFAQENLVAAVDERIVHHADKGELKVTLVISDAKITVVDTIVVTLQADVPESMSVTMPNLVEALDPFLWGIVKVESRGKKLLDNSRVLYEKIIELEPIQAQTAEIPALTFAATVNNIDIVATTEAQMVEVVEYMTIDENTDIAEGKGQADIPFEMPVIVYYIVAAVVVLIIIIILLVLRARRKAKEIIPVFACPHEVAVNRFKRLENEMLLHDQQFKLFFELTCLILRYYIEDRFDLNAPDLTTEEFLAKAASTGKLSGDQTAKLKGFMNQCDMVKFAKYAPSIDDANNALILAEDFVEKSTNYEVKIEVTGKDLYAMFQRAEVKS